MSIRISMPLACADLRYLQVSSVFRLFMTLPLRRQLVMPFSCLSTHLNCGFRALSDKKIKLHVVHVARVE